jgi:transglutaminase-like putative cysteine protease
MTGLPEAPGAPAVILYRQVDRDDSGMGPHEYNYVRLKIFTEEGRKYADVEVPFFWQEGGIHNIKGRSIRPDGTITNFDGKAYDKTIVKARGVKFLAKTFTLPDVQVGSIVEYKYSYDMDPAYVFDSHWILSEDLFTKEAHFTLKPNTYFALRWSWPNSLPPGTNPPKADPHGTIHLDTQNVPGFQVEDYMPPERELKLRIDFEYSDHGVETDPNRYWKQQGKALNSKVENFVGKHKEIEQAVAETVAAGDSPELKAEKLYARVQKMRNTSFEAQKTDEELKREKAKQINNVAEVWKQGYGDGYQLTWLYLAMVRAAGIEAYPVYVSTRDQYFFTPSAQNVRQLNSNVVLLKLNGNEVYCDPGTALAPFGLLPWTESWVTGLKVDKDGGSWVSTSVPPSAVSKIDRKADLKLSDDGTLSGKVTITFSGLEALSRRLEMRNQDDAERKTFLENQIKEYIPVGIEANLTNKPDWASSASTLIAEYEIKVPGWISGAGKRALCPVGLFSATEKQVFEHTTRIHPIYFNFPSEKRDDITIQLPLGWQASSLPKPQDLNGNLVLYSNKADNNNGTLHLTRSLTVNAILLEPTTYAPLRNFFQAVRTGDEQQIIIQPGTASAGQ